MSLANQVTEEIELSVVTGDVMSPADGFGAKLKAIRRDLREEYLQPHDKPWIIGFSGGKDSTLLAHLVIECLLAIPPDERKRRVYLVCNDTLVESPVFQEFVNHLLCQIAENLETLRIPVEVVRTSPKVEESFWVNLLGRGYPAPNRTFRWCTDRMKIRPTSRFIRELVTHHGEAILLLGVRRAESSARAANIAKHKPLQEQPGSVARMGQRQPCGTRPESSKRNADARANGNRDGEIIQRQNSLTASRTRLSAALLLVIGGE